MPALYDGKEPMASCARLWSRLPAVHRTVWLRAAGLDCDFNVRRDLSCFDPEQSACLLLALDDMTEFFSAAIGARVAA